MKPQQGNTLNQNYAHRAPGAADHDIDRGYKRLLQAVFFGTAHRSQTGKHRRLVSIPVLCLSLVASFAHFANAVDIGPGYGIANVLTDSSGGRLIVDNFNPMTLGPGTYNVLSFNYDAALAGDVQPFLAILTGTNLYQAIAVGATLNVPGAVQDTSVAFGGSNVFTLSSTTVVYGGIASFGQNPIPLNQNAGFTDHEGGGQPASSYSVTLGGQVPFDGSFSNPDIGRVYAFSITVRPAAVPEPSSMMLGLVGVFGLIVMSFRRRGKAKLGSSALAGLLFVALCGTPAHGAPPPPAPITWSAPTTISGDSNVSLTGTLFGAANNGGTGVSATTVNSVLFNPFVTDGTNTTFTSGNFTLSAANSVSGSSGFGSPQNPFAALSTPYKNLLASASYVLPGPLNLTISGLTAGQVYLVQLWVNYSDLTSPATETISAVNSTILQYNTTSTVGGVGQFVTGTFTANSSTELITLDNGAVPPSQATLLNAVQVRAVPEPSVWAMMGAGSACLLATMHFRRRRI